MHTATTRSNETIVQQHMDHERPKQPRTTKTTKSPTPFYLYSNDTTSPNNDIEMAKIMQTCPDKKIPNIINKNFKDIIKTN